MLALLFGISGFLLLAHPSNLPGVDEAWDTLEQMHAEGKTTDKQPTSERISVLNLKAHFAEGRGCHTIKSVFLMFAYVCLLYNDVFA